MEIWSFNNYVRSTKIYAIWREQCLIRDKFQCIITWSRQNLQVHHLHPFWHLLENCNIYDYMCNKELFDINNWVTIRSDLHKWFHQEYWNQYFLERDFEDYKKRIKNIIKTS
jgi:hypothetical protein